MELPTPSETRTKSSVSDKECLRSGGVYVFVSFADPTTGTSSDWGFGALGAKIGYTYEFRNQGDNGEYYGFIAPPSEIKPNAEEVLQSLIGLTTKAEELKILP